MMFETMASFLWFFIHFVLAICTGIVFEDKLIEFENKIARICRAVLKTINQTIKEAIQ